MSFVISSVLPFPNISWWCRILDAPVITWDLAEHFEKASYRNRYFVPGANGLLQLSIPIEGGREHRAPMGETGISCRQDWQTRHWRSLCSAYNRAAYFEFYSSSLHTLFATHYEKLIDFNLASVRWVKHQLALRFLESTVTEFKKGYPDSLFDLRGMKPGVESSTSVDFPLYFQVFQERTGFLPGLSILDLLFAEGPFTLEWLRQNREAVIAL